MGYYILTMGNIITVCISSKQGSSGRSSGGGRSKRSRDVGVYTGGGGGGKIAYQNNQINTLLLHGP